ncbi:hypothetical protein [Deinococcus yunweiensis]|uniref:hypothetical protein n=1 Tax=Deinococcus yunweiensis TaxID=367282 RepID=UPI00398E6D6A
MTNDKGSGHLIDLMFQNKGWAKFWNGFIVFGDWTSLAPAVLLIIALANGFDNKWPPLLWTTVVGIVIGSSSKTLKSYKDRRDKEISNQKTSTDRAEIEALKVKLDETEKTHAEQVEAFLTSITDSYNEGVADGAEEKMTRWAEVARLHEAGMVNTHRQLTDRLKPPTGGEPSTECIISYLQAILAGFRTFYPASERTPLDVTASLAVVAADRQQVHLVKIEPGGRNRDRQLPRPCDVSQLSWGMSDLLINDQDSIYTPDIRTCGGNPQRGYLSVANLAVRNIDGRIIAIVNVDSPGEDTFGSPEQVQQAYQYCLPMLSSIALSLLDPRMFRNERGPGS